MIPRVGRENLMPPSPAPTSSRGGSSVSKPTANSRRRSVGGRESLSAGRRQSLVPPSSAPTAKPDPRPINDKKYQQECIRRLLQFLSSTSYEYPVTTKSLARPSGKDFGNIVTHMLRLLDSSFQDGTMKLEDEIAMNFKAMGYPYPISKTALVAAGSPHTWPALLAALTWLMEHMQCFKTDDIKDSAADNGKPFESLHELEQKTDKAFFQYLGQAYTAFLKGDVATQEQVETNLAERFERDDTFLEQELERITDLNATIAEKINHLKQESQEYVSLLSVRARVSVILAPSLRPCTHTQLCLSFSFSLQPSDLRQKERRLRQRSRRVSRPHWKDGRTQERAFTED
jgi:kinetochore protein NDC80